MLIHNDEASTDGTSLYDPESFNTNTGYDYRENKYPSVTPTNPNYRGETMWEYIFVGGNGGLGIISNYNGGTPYTSRIIGTQHIDSSFTGDEFYGYTRDDVVTKAGIYGEASDVEVDNTTTFNFTITYAQFYKI